MDSKKLAEAITNVPDVIGQLYTDLASPAAKAIGAALGTVFEFSTSFLLPVKLLNERFKVNFAKRMSEYNAKLQEIPESRRCEVHPQIGTPIVEKLTYTTTDEIADLFTTLLAKASDCEHANIAHPSFISIIERLSTDEAKIIKYLKGRKFVEYCDLRGDLKDSEGFINVAKRLTIIPRDVVLEYPQNIQAYLSNLESLGLLSDQTGLHKTNKKGEEEIKKYVHYDDVVSKLVPQKYKSVSIHRSFLEVTELGQLFILACVK